MMNGAPAAAAGASAAAAAAIANAIKASGAIVHVESSDFNTIMQMVEAPLVVRAQVGLFTKKYQYLTGYKGLVFYTKSETPLILPEDAEMIEAKKIWIPG
jgi:hypothetical protein